MTSVTNVSRSRVSDTSKYNASCEIRTSKLTRSGVFVGYITEISRSLNPNYPKINGGQLQ